MSSAGSNTAQRLSFASEPLDSASITLDRRQEKLTQLRSLRQRCKEAAGTLTIDHEVQLVRELIQTKAVDEDFSVAVRERWQTWSRNADPFRTELASTAASELSKAAEVEASSGSDSDSQLDDSASEGPDEPSGSGMTSKGKRKGVFRPKGPKKRIGSSERGMDEDWDAVRREREARLTELDASLPNAFRFTERQLKVYAHRLKQKYLNSLDRPFEAAQLHKLLHHSRKVAQPGAVQPSQDASVPGPSIQNAPSRPSVYHISFFISSLDPSTDDVAAQQKNADAAAVSDVDARDNYVKRICGDGLGGSKRSQTIELLSTQTLSDLLGTLVCWSDEQPERHGWQQRLQKTSYCPDATAAGQEAVASLQQDLSGDEESQETCSARYTGRRRHTDVALIIEDKLYSKGLRAGDALYEADYATLLNEWKSRCGLSDAQAGWSSSGGDLSLRLDQLGSIRIGRPYWLLHQGDCVHAFVIEQIRALRPLEEKGTFSSDLENVPSGSAVTPFPRITWLSTPAMLRFAADDKDNYGLGHRILLWEGLMPMQSSGAGPEVGALAAGDLTQRSALQVALGRTRRKDEGMLRKKQGKCLACLLRKAQIGILGGDRVRLPVGSDDDERGKQTEMSGLDDHLVTLCVSCAVILGLPTREPEAGASEAPVQLDWQRIHAQKPRKAGWTVFPMY